MPESDQRLDEFKIDYLIDGEIERVFNDLFRRIMQGDPSLPRIIKCGKELQATVEEIPVVRLEAGTARRSSSMATS